MEKQILIPSKVLQVISRITNKFKIFLESNIVIEEQKENPFVSLNIHIHNEIILVQINRHGQVEVLENLYVIKTPRELIDILQLNCDYNLYLKMLDIILNQYVPIEVKYELHDDIQLPPKIIALFYNELKKYEANCFKAELEDNDLPDPSFSLKDVKASDEEL